MPHVPDPTGSTSDHLQTGWWFTADDLRPVRERLLELSVRRPHVPEVSLLEPTRTRCQDRYLDTSDWKLYRAGYALRVRTRAKRMEATLEPLEPVEAGASPRPEHTQPLAEETAEAILRGAGPVSERLRLLGCGPEDLRLLGTVSTVREVFPVLAGARPGGSITLERGRLLGAEDSPPFLRIELMQASDSGPSAASDQTSPFSALALRLSEVGALTVAEESRFAWMLRASGLVPRRAPELGPSVVEPGMTAAEAAFAVLRRHCGAFLRHEPGTRVGDDPEHLHDMRVATRRMRAALRVFANALPPDDARLLREELRATADALGTVRDLDVQIEQMEAWAASLITVPREAAQPLVDALRRRRGVARERLLEHLDSRRFRLLKALLVRRLRGGPARQPDRGSLPSGASEPIRAMAPRLIRRARRKVARAAGKIEPSSPPAAYHALRIRGKRLRYALEFLEPLYGTPARRLIEVLVGMQDTLGLHQDAQVSMALVHDLVQHEAGLPPSSLVAAGEISQMLVARAERLRAEFPEAYRRLRGKRWRSWKKTARASLARSRAEGAMGPSAGMDPRVAPNPESTGGQDGGLSPELPSDSAEG